MGQIEIDTSKYGREPDWDDLPVLPTRNLVMFPGVTVPLSIGREGSLKLAERAAETCTPIAVICQTDAGDDNPNMRGLYKYGVVADVFKVLQLPDETHTALLRARSRFRVFGKGVRAAESPTGLSVRAVAVDDVAFADAERFGAIVDECINKSAEIIEEATHMSKEFTGMARSLRSDVERLHYVATNAPVETSVKQALLAQSDLTRRAEMLLAALMVEHRKAELRHEIIVKASDRMKDNQRTAYLQQQLDTIREELYGEDAPDTDNDISELTARAGKTEFTAAARKAFDKELAKLRRLNPQSPDYAVQYSYLETLLDLPWGIHTQQLPSLAEARSILEADHYGLEKVKERILEQIAVYFSGDAPRSPILCLVGPPGVGKTSLGRSIARAVGRSYQRVSLGGVHDEAEVRGHRRTYVGAMPGRIIKALRSAATADPVMVLDEIDKLGADHRGDPSDAMLEVLDPEQNQAFHDNYIDIDFDLSRVMFVATANNLSTVPPALLDRMEIVELSGYLLEEKMEIARHHLIPRVLADNCLSADEYVLGDDTLAAIIERYTSESGVRRLEKVLASLARKILLARLEGRPVEMPLRPEGLEPLLGLAPYVKDKTDDGLPGVVTGLAWTSVGGEIMLAEASLSRGKGEKLTVTGNLGDVMKESATIAYQWVRAHAESLGIAAADFEDRHLHIHFPEGAIPKDGPSAGITIATAIASAFTGRAVRPRLAMTGEITLRGRVLPVGGVKEKILAAKRAGVTDIILSSDNRRDIAQIPERYLDGLEFHYVDIVSQVVEMAIPATC